MRTHPEISTGPLSSRDCFFIEKRCFFISRNLAIQELTQRKDLVYCKSDINKKRLTFNADGYLTAQNIEYVRSQNPFYALNRSILIFLTVFSKHRDQITNINLSYLTLAPKKQQIHPPFPQCYRSDNPRFQNNFLSSLESLEY